MRLKAHGILFAFVVVALSTAAYGAGQIGTSLQARLEVLQPDEKVPVIVHMADRVNLAGYKVGLPSEKARKRRDMILALRSHASRSQATVGRFLGSRGLQVERTLWMVNALSLSVPARLVTALSNIPGVDRVVLDDVIVRPTGIGSSGAAQYGESFADAAPEWNIGMIKAPDLWSLGYDGTGIVVANLDFGVDPAHEELGPRYRGGSNSWFDPNGEHATPWDSHPDGHGTGSMGLMVGGDLFGTSIGAAPGATWIAAKIFNDAGSASFSAIHDSLQWTLDPDANAGTDDAPHVVNNSWGITDRVNECVLEFQADIQSLKTAGILVVFSAGNSGPSGSTSLSPANNPSGFAVGMVNDSKTVDLGSSRGPSACGEDVFPEVMAPGVVVITATTTVGGIFPASYTQQTGTSFAAPQVAGVMALLVQAFPGASVPQIEAALTSSAEDLGVFGPDMNYGNGLVDALAAYNVLNGAGSCSDTDGDLVSAGAGCTGIVDCDDTNDQIWATPAEVPTLEWSDHDTLTWTAPLSPGGATGTVVYDVLRSGDPGDFDAAPLCVESNDGTDRIASDTDVPDVATTWFYLVRAENSCPLGKGSLGAGSDLLERTAAGCP
jgi:serine protease AprX